MYLAPDSTYIYAPLVNDWYDWQALEILQDETFEAIIIDGPYKTTDRVHLIDWINAYPNVFNQSRFVVADDVNQQIIGNLFNFKQFANYYITTLEMRKHGS